MRKHVATRGRALFPILLAVFLLSPLSARGEGPIPVGDSLGVLDGQLPEIIHRSPRINYDIDLAQQKYFIHVPANYTGKEAFGLIVYTHPANQIEQLPDGWGKVLADRKLIFVAAQNAGNDQADNRRLGLASLGALRMAQLCKIDPQRVFAAGLSGGARVA